LTQRRRESVGIIKSVKNLHGVIVDSKGLLSLNMNRLYMPTLPEGFQIEIKEAIHIQKEQHYLNQQLHHVNLTYHFNAHTCLLCAILLSQLIFISFYCNSTF